MNRSPIRRPPSPTSSRDGGFTLIELSVVLLILSILTPMIYGVLNWVQKDAVSVGSRDIATGQLQVIGEALSRQIHAAAIPAGISSAFVSATANTLVFYAALGNANGPTELAIQAVPSCAGCTTDNLVENVTQPGLNPGPGPATGQPTYTGTSTRTILGSGVIPTTNAVTVGSDCSSVSPSVLGIFEYLQLSGSCLPLASGSPVGLSGSQMLQVENLVITITAVDTLRPTSTATATDTLQVSLPNIDYYNETSTTT
jgi:prepilin-type N-terminal cleavage/methylation domain-containing protein